MKIVLQVLLLSLILLILVKFIRIYEVATPSMEPFIKTGSIVISINKMGNSKFKKNDVVVYKIPQNIVLVTHRIIKTINVHRKVFYITKGDNNNSEDPYPISRDEIIGKVIVVIPYLGILLKNISSYKLLSITFYGPIGFLFGKSIRNFFKAIK